MRSAVQAGLLCLSGLSVAGCGKERPDPPKAGAVELEGSKLGQAGALSIDLRKIEGKSFVIAHRFTAVSMVEHIPTVTPKDGTHSCEIKELGKVGDLTTFMITVDGTKYVLLERHSACEMRRFDELPSAKQ